MEAYDVRMVAPTPTQLLRFSCLPAFPTLIHHSSRSSPLWARSAVRVEPAATESYLPVAQLILTGTLLLRFDCRCCCCCCCNAMCRGGDMTLGYVTMQIECRPPEGAYCMTPGGTRYQDGVTKPLVARVAELEEKLVQCSIENATAKQVRWVATVCGSSGRFMGFSSEERRRAPTRS